MSTHKTPAEIREIERALHESTRREFARRQAELGKAGLLVELDPVRRSGEGRHYTSYVEATLRFADGDVHDVLFFHIAREGELTVDPADAEAWIARTVDEIVRDAESS